jgi:hypothetical protein
MQQKAQESKRKNFPCAIFCVFSFIRPLLLLSALFAHVCYICFIFLPCLLFHCLLLPCALYSSMLLSFALIHSVLLFLLAVAFFCSCPLVLSVGLCGFLGVCTHCFVYMLLSIAFRCSMLLSVAIYHVVSSPACFGISMYSNVFYFSICCYLLPSVFSVTLAFALSLSWPLGGPQGPKT